MDRAEDVATLQAGVREVGRLRDEANLRKAQQPEAGSDTDEPARLLAKLEASRRLPRFLARFAVYTVTERVLHLSHPRWYLDELAAGEQVDVTGVEELCSYYSGREVRVLVEGRTFDIKVGQKRQEAPQTP